MRATEDSANNNTNKNNNNAHDKLTKLIKL